jgi:hypothetical protein
MFLLLRVLMGWGGSGFGVCLGKWGDIETKVWISKCNMLACLVKLRAGGFIKELMNKAQSKIHANYDL